jgi:hypothetical protein
LLISTFDGSFQKKAGVIPQPFRTLKGKTPVCYKADIGDPGRHVMGARLKPNMVELDGPWVRLSEETVSEAVSVFKRDEIYYFMADSPLPIEYATYKIIGTIAPKRESNR